MKCTACGAALPATSLICSFCGTRNAVDLRHLSATTDKAPDAPRPCPECGTPMHSVNVGNRKRLFIEQCVRCHGLFFDLNELQALLDDAVTPAYEVNLPLLFTLQKESPVPRRKATYVPCPVCSKIMNRVNFGRRSGVVVDHCRNHGMWLEGGELHRLMEWKKAGGQVLDRQRGVEDTRADDLLRALTEKQESSIVLRSLGRLMRSIDQA
jgi:Zn-finger nucleic acid-binding protein